MEGSRVERAAQNVGAQQRSLEQGLPATAGAEGRDDFAAAVLLPRRVIGGQDKTQ